MIFIRSGILAVFATFGATCVLAQDLVMQTLINELLVGRSGSFEVADIDQDGEPEALVTYTDDCTVAGCLFSIVDVAESGELDEVAYQYGENPVLISEGTVIEANGVYFNWTGFALLPYFDAYGNLEFFNGRTEERKKIMELSPWMTDLRNKDIQVANMDILGDKTPERFAWLQGLEYSVAQMRPWYVFDKSGDIIATGAFMDRPFLFHLADRKAAALITSNGNGFETVILE